MPLNDLQTSVQPVSKRPLGKHCLIVPETHTPAHIHDVVLLRKKIDHRMCGIAKLRTACILKAEHIPCKLDYCKLHAEAESEKRHIVFPGVFDRPDLPIDPALAKSARNKDSVKSSERLPNLCCVMEAL